MMGKRSFFWVLFSVFCLTQIIAGIMDLRVSLAQSGTESIELDGFQDTDFTPDGDAFLESMGSFPEIGQDVELIIEDEKDPSSFNWSGFLKFEAEYGFQKSGNRFSNPQTTLFLQTEYVFSPDVKSRMSAEACYDLEEDIFNTTLKEMYIDGTITPHFSIRAGRQTVVFSNSDYARILDITNPRDLTQPGLISIEDARLPVGIIRLSAGFDPWVIEGVTILEHPGSLLADRGDDFDYYAPLKIPGVILLDESLPGSGIQAVSFALKVTRQFNGGDISFVVGSTYDDQPYLTVTGQDRDALYLTPEYDRYRTFGIQGNITRGSMLFKFETAFQQDIEFMRQDFIPRIFSGDPLANCPASDSGNRLKSLAGLEYSGINDLRITLEAQINHIFDHQPWLNAGEDEYRTYFQTTYSLLNDTLDLDLLWIGFHPGGGNIFRLSSTYDLFDGFSLQAGIIFYESDDSASPVYAYQDQDRVFFRMKYSF